MKILEGDVDDPRILALLRMHLAGALAHAPLHSVHVLDAKELRAPRIDFWAVWEDESLLGIGALKELAPDHGEIKSMHVAEERRRAGTGSLILRHILAAARAKGMRRLSLETGAEEYSLPARAFYQAHGFSYCEPFDGYGSDPNNVFMTLEL